MVTAAGGARQIGPPICVVAPPAFSLVLLLFLPGLLLCFPALQRHSRRLFVAAVRPGYDPQIIDPRSRAVTSRRVTINAASVVTVS